MGLQPPHLLNTKIKFFNYFKNNEIVDKGLSLEVRSEEETSQSHSQLTHIHIVL